MIRFIDLGGQYYADDSDDKEYQTFAFIDTVVDRFVEANDEQFWQCWDDFAEDYKLGEKWREMELKRFKSLVDPKYFKPITF